MTINGPEMDYPTFSEMMSQLAADGKTTGETQSKELIHFTQLNQKRMERIDKSTALDVALIDLIMNLKEKQVWQVITEAWCGDSAQNLPVIGKLAKASGGNVSLSIVLRDANPELIDQYLTNGGRSIPKLIVRNEQGQLLNTWGPRPTAAQTLYNNWKANPKGKSWEDFELELHTWYAKDKTKSTQNELYDVIQKAAVKSAAASSMEQPNK